jgi:hypothetical protein
MHPDRIVIGAFDDADGDIVERLHGGIDAPVVRCDVSSAEMIKLAANAALVTRISFINEIANVCEATGADVVTVAEGIGLDRRIGPAFLRAGIGYGGSCFPKDSLALKQLAANSGYSFQLLNAVIEVNELQKRRSSASSPSCFGSVRGGRITARARVRTRTTSRPAFVLAGCWPRRRRVVGPHRAEAAPRRQVATVEDAARGADAVARDRGAARRRGLGSSGRRARRSSSTDATCSIRRDARRRLRTAGSAAPPALQ